MIRCWILFLFCTSSLFAQNILSLLPASAGKWQKKDPSELYKGDSLYTLIDGGAEIFVEYGFEEAAVQNYSDEAGNIIDVEIYQMAGPSSAYGIFSLNTLKTGRRIDFSSNASSGNEFLIFQKGKYYICLTALKINENTKEGLFKIAEAIDALILPAEKPPLITRFNEIKDSKKVYIKGRLGFYNLTTLNPGDGFRIDEGVCLETEHGRHFVLRYNNADECSTNYLTMVNNFRMNTQYTAVSINANESLIKDKSAFIKCSCHGNYLILSVSGNRKQMEITWKKLKSISLNERNE